MSTTHQRSRRRSQRRRRRDFFGRKKKILRERKKKEGGGWPPGNALGSPNNKRNQTERGERADQLPSLLVRWFRGRVGKGAAFLHTHTIPPPSFHDGRASGSKTRPLPPAQRYPSPLLGFFKNVVCSTQNPVSSSLNVQKRFNFHWISEKERDWETGARPARDKIDGGVPSLFFKKGEIFFFFAFI